MKEKISFLICLAIILLSSNLYGQDKIHRTSTNLDTYAGTWEYATATDTFQIVLIKAQWDTNHSLTDCLFGVHYYKKNGKVIADYRNLLPNLSRKNQTIYATNAVSPENTSYFKPNRLSFSFRDRIKHRIPSGWLTRDPNKPDEIKWHFNKEEKQGRLLLNVPPEERPQPGYSVPDEVIMKKIK